uniref:ABC transmembrane type-1 domain-containing protein n=2 Tax=Caenorhabditis tropicalis TaxID=1561998 RepID=A0A1I7UFM7_9PELO
MTSPNLFGFFLLFHRLSPFSLLSSNRRLICYPAYCITVSAVLLMIFRFYWMIFRIDSPFLNFQWAESKLYGFVSLESAILTVALIKMGATRSLESTQRSLQELQNLRLEKIQKIKDNYRVLWCRAFFGALFVFLSFSLTSIYLAVHKKALLDSKSSWYWILDPIAAILGAYSNFLFLPVHALRAHAVAREFEVFNEEMAEADREKRLVNPHVLREFGARQIKMFEYANFLTDRMERFMIWAPALSILAFLMASYVVSE